MDLDGTLLKGDSLEECLVSAMRHAPWVVFLIPFWLLQGRARLKSELARRARLDAATLPFNPAVLDFVRRERARGRRTVLATACDRAVAEQVARELGLFDEVIASDGVSNLKGNRKAEALRARFGADGFDYLGNSGADLPIWASAGTSWIYGSKASPLIRRAERDGVRLALVESPASRRWPLLGALRAHQWIKNLLVFVPLVTAHRLHDPAAIAMASLAFIAFSLAASGAYLMNDLADLENDRRHPEKRSRPFAAGDLPLWIGVVLAPVLVASSVGLAALIGGDFLFELAIYVAGTVAYSVWLKRLMLVDVFTLACLYGVRILGGAAAIQVPVSHWLLVFSLFLFLSLALAKRHAELSGMARRDATDAPGRGYVTGDRLPVAITGVTCGQISVMVFALYISSPDVGALYSRPGVLWAACPVLFYWVTRIWFLAYRGELHEDPVVFALHDRVSLLLGVAMLAIVVLAT